MPLPFLSCLPEGPGTQAVAATVNTVSRGELLPLCLPCLLEGPGTQALAATVIRTVSLRSHILACWIAENSGGNGLVPDGLFAHSGLSIATLSAPPSRRTAEPGQEEEG